MSQLEISSDSVNHARQPNEAGTYDAGEGCDSIMPASADSKHREFDSGPSVVLTDSRSRPDHEKHATSGASGQSATLDASNSLRATGSGGAQRPIESSTESSALSSGENNETGSGSLYSGKPIASFRRQRASRACETCHARKVRCDAASLGVPCTNCVAFSIECKIPAPKRKKNQKRDSNSNDSNDNDPPMPMKRISMRPDLENIRQLEDKPDQQHCATIVMPNPPPAAPTTSQPVPPDSGDSGNLAGQYPSFMKPKFARAPIREAGRVAYLGESSNLSLLVHDKHGLSDVVHYPLPDDIRGPRARLCDLDNLEIDILHQRGAFLLPPRSLCDELVEAYFTWVAPVVPIINRSRFMRRYHDPKNPPSLLLLQAILLAGCRVCTNPQLMDAGGSTTPAAMTFYKRAKALYDANYEDDRVTIVQALVLMGWYWEGPEDVTKNVFYWTRVATVVAQGSGMHRSVESSQLSRTDKRLWKRIWWTLFTRDRSVAVALGRPVLINTDDSDVEMITEDDFIEDETDTFSGVPAPAEYPPDHIHVQFFLQYVKLCEIMGLVLSQQYSVAGKARWSNAIDLTHSDIALADWLQNCPREMCWDKNRHHFWSALLHSNYYTTLCLLHRAHMPPATMANAHGAGRGQSAHQGLFGPNGARIYPSKTIAFQAAAMVTSIISQLQVHDQLRFTPAFIVYSLFSALIMHVYQMRSSDPSTVAACHEKISICMQALRDVSHAWLVAKMVHTLFESILGNKAMKEKMQKAAGKRHQHFRQMQKQAGHDHQTRHNNVQKHHYHSTGVPYVPPATLQKDMMSGSNDMVDPNATEIASSAAGVPGSPPLAAPTVNSNLDAASAVATINDTTIHGVTTTSIRPSELTQIPGQAGHQAAFHRKRKHSDLDPVAYPGGGTSAPQMSYERSRPQTPVDRAMDANGDGTQSHTQHLCSNAEHARKGLQQQQQQQQQCGNQALHDSALGDAPEAVDYGVTRPTTPFNHPYSFSIPNTPPDLFLVTRNSPNLSQTMWENFQPDQLFPDGAMGGVSINEELNFCPSDPVPESVPPGVTIDNNVNGRAGTIHDAAVDPSLQTSAIPHTSGHIPNVPMHNAHAPTSVMPHEALPAAEDGTKPQDQKHAFSPGGYQPSPLNGTSGLGPPPNPGDRPPSDDDWSSSSRGASGGPIVPLTLNVEDWFQFFGLQGAFDTA